MCNDKRMFVVDWFRLPFNLFWKKQNNKQKDDERCEQIMDGGMNVDVDLFSRELSDALQKKALAARMECHSICSVGTNHYATETLRSGPTPDEFEKWYLIGQARGCSARALATTASLQNC